MALVEASQDIIELVQSIAIELGLDKDVDFLVFKNQKKAKDIVETKKGNDVDEYAYKADSLVCLFVKEEAYYNLDEKHRYLSLKCKMLEYVYDYEKEKLSKNAPMLCIPWSFLDKYGKDALDNARLNMMVLQQLKDEEESKKAEKKTKRKKNY